MFFSLLSFCLIVMLMTAKGVIAAEKGSVGKTWKTVDELTATERAEIDLQTNAPRDTEIPYIPAKKYPFVPPYTVEEMVYLAMEFPHVSRWSYAMADTFGSLTSAGYLNRPLLYEGKFPQAREVELAPEVAVRIRAQEEAGRLVFETTVAEGKGP